MTHPLIALLSESTEAREAMLGLGIHSHSNWYRYIVDMLEAHERYGGNVFEGIRTILLNINLEKSQTTKRNIDIAMKTVQPPMLFLCSDCPRRELV